MIALIAQKLESEEWYRFHADFRQALPKHRKKSLNIFTSLLFCMAASPFYEGDLSVEHLAIKKVNDE